MKFNDYFEFPRELNLEPFTVQGLAKVEGEVIEDDMNTTGDGSSGGGKCNGAEEESPCTEYRLVSSHITV